MSSKKVTNRDQPLNKKQVDEHSPGLLQSDTLSESGSKQLHLIHTLLKTLDLEKLLALFFDATKEMVGCDGLSYQLDELNTSIQLGERSTHHYHYELQVGQISLGEISFFRRHTFSQSDIEQLEQALCQLLFPLRNAIQYQKAVNMAHLDPMTSLYNRAALTHSIKRFTKSSRRNGNSLGVIMMDLDHFKRINDNYGHLFGDQVIIESAKQIQKLVRGDDLLFRYGGEEFLALLQTNNTETLKQVAERIRIAIENLKLTSADQKVPLSISLGIATFQKTESIEATIGRADKALYRAKNAGRNRVVSDDH